MEPTAVIPKGLGSKRDAQGVLRILPEFELGLTDIESFSHSWRSRFCPLPIFMKKRPPLSRCQIQIPSAVRDSF